MDFREYLRENIVCLDGGMGTLLQKEGLCPGELPETWNITHSKVIEGIHRAYFEAGANVVYANTFDGETLKEAKEALAFCQFHDILPGSAIREVEEDSLRTFSYGEEICDRL